MKKSRSSQLVNSINPRFLRCILLTAQLLLGHIGNLESTLRTSMAPRRSTARGLSATPVRAATPSQRSTRATSALEQDDAIPRRATRESSQQPSKAKGDVNNPRLPEVQIQQSYAYGSSKTPVLPTQLIARSRMNLREMADTIDVGVDQAEQHLQNHIIETHANLQSDSRTDRARRRASREPSHESDDAAQSRTQRVAAWASSVDNPELGKIPEEGLGEEDEDEEELEDDQEVARSTPDDASNKDTDPSSFPSGMFDHSYNYERGLRKPNITVRQRKEPIIPKVWNTTKTQAQRSREALSHLMSSLSTWLSRLLHATSEAIKGLPNSRLVPIVTNLVFGLLLVGAASLFFCYTYTNFVCDPLSQSSMSTTLQRYCGTCARSTLPLNYTAGADNDISKLTAAISNINIQLRNLESKINNKFDAHNIMIEKDIEALRRQQTELVNHVANLQRGGKGGLSGGGISGEVASPVIPKINYFALNNGATIEPRLTSPTMQKPFAFAQRVLLRMVLSARYVTKSPATALTPWQDVGDCWCASSSPTAVHGQQQTNAQDSDEVEDAETMRLGIKTIEPIYPTELVVENYPSSGSLMPGSTPRTIELWADFEHLNSREWDTLNLRSMQDSTGTANSGSPLGPSYALLARVEYDASTSARSHVQSFPLTVNTAVEELKYAAHRFVVRVVRNYGAEYTCLYRVRLHGVPVSDHEGPNEV